MQLVRLPCAGLALFAWVAVLVAQPLVAINGTVEGPVVVNALFLSACFACSRSMQPLHQTTFTRSLFWAFPGLLPRPSEDLCHLPRGAHIVSMQRMILSSAVSVTRCAQFIWDCAECLLEYQPIHTPAYFKMSNLLQGRAQLHRLLSGWTICSIHVCMFEHSVIGIHFILTAIVVW